MKKLLTNLSLAAATILLLGSCAKINERIDDLEGRINGLEKESIASISTQIESINSSIADLGTIRTNIQNLTSTTAAQAQDIADLNNEDTEIGKKISDLKKADESINTRIDDLQKYVNDTLKAYATTEWVNATFSTLAQYEATCDTIAKIDDRIGSMDTRLSKSIEDCADSLKSWVNVQLDGYYTIAQMDAKVAEMNAQIDTLSSTSAATADSLKAEIAAAKAEIDTVKANIRAEYKSAIETAITALDGKFSNELQTKISQVKLQIDNLTTSVNTLQFNIDALTGRVEALEAMIQSVVIVPAYSDGSVKSEDGVLELNFAVNPASAVARLKEDSVKILLTKVLTKAVVLDTVPTNSIKVFTTDLNKGTISIQANIAKIIDELGDNESLAVAVNVKNGISHFTTDFVPVESHFTYAEIAGVKWALENLAVSESGKREFNNTGHVIGDYFQWATYAGYCGDASDSDKGLLIYTSFTSNLCGDAENAFSFKDDSYQFSIPDGWGEGGIAPYCTEDEGYTKYTGDAVSTLESIDDAATIILGEEWRMPTIEEYESLISATYWAWDATDCGYYVFLPSDAPGKSAGTYGEIMGLNKSKAKLFFPATGYGYFGNLMYNNIMEACGQYLSLTYDNESIMPTYTAKQFKFDTPSAGGVKTDGDLRANGAPIRPVKAATAE